MTSSNGNTFLVTDHLCGEFTGHWWIPLTKASDAELWCFFDLRLNIRLSKQHWGKPQDGCSCNHRHHAAAKTEAQQNGFALYHSYNRTIILGFIWILDFRFKMVLVLRRRYFIPIRCNSGKRKMWPWRWMHHFDFQHWRWLHALMTMVASFQVGNFWHTHSRSPADKYAYIGCVLSSVIRVRSLALTPISTV